MKSKQSIFANIFKINLLFPICAFLVLGISNASLAETVKFSTTWGVLTVHSDDGIHYTGTYGKKGGEIYGNYQAGTRTFTGIWHKPKSKKKCTSKREGTPYWGTVEYTVNSSETAFTGVWGYCAVSPTHKWSGTLK
jgi:hypothetical protein